MTHPRDSFPVQQQLESKLQSLLLNFCYKLYLQKKSDDEVIAAIAAKDLPRMSRQDWWNLKLWFRQREMSAPAQMALIRKKIGMSA